MAAPKCSDADFIRTWREGGIRLVCRRFDMRERPAYTRRRRLEELHDVCLESPLQLAVHHKAMIPLRVKTGCVIVGSDAHIWRTDFTAAQRAFPLFIEKYRPKAVILNGDIFDGASVSKHASIGWEKKPDVHEELAACKTWLEGVEEAADGAKKFWTLGNHDMRFEAYLASRAGDMKGVKGMHLKDHFPAWKPAWSICINGNVMVKHRLRGGQHAPYNNAVQSGMSCVTGHLHSAKCVPYSDYTGTRWGVDTGCLADPYDEQFLDYTEAGAVNWRSGFGMLSWVNGRLLQPELILKYDERHVEFRGEIIRV